MKFSVTAFPDQLFELLITAAPFIRVTVTDDKDAPDGVAAASTIVPRFTLSPLGFVRLNCSAPIPLAPGICVVFGGVPETVATANTGGVAVGVLVVVFVAVFVGVLVVVAVSVLVVVLVGVFVAVAVAVLVAVVVAVDVAVLVDVLVAVFVVVLVGVFVAVAVAV